MITLKSYFITLYRAIIGKGHKDLSALAQRHNFIVDSMTDVIIDYHNALDEIEKLRTKKPIVKKAAKKPSSK